MRSLRAAADCHWQGMSSANPRWEAGACAAGLGRSKAGVVAEIAGFDVEYGTQNENADVAEKAGAADFGADFDAGVNDLLAIVVGAESTRDQGYGPHFGKCFAFEELRFWLPSGFAALPFYFCDPSVCERK